MRSPIREIRPTPDCQAKSSAASASHRTSLISRMPPSPAHLRDAFALINPCSDGPGSTGLGTNSRRRLEAGQHRPFAGAVGSCFFGPSHATLEGSTSGKSVSGDPRRPRSPQQTSGSHSGRSDFSPGQLGGICSGGSDWRRRKPEPPTWKKPPVRAPHGQGDLAALTRCAGWSAFESGPRKGKRMNEGAVLGMQGRRTCSQAP
jgi:hypothetical protein